MNRLVTIGILIIYIYFNNSSRENNMRILLLISLFLISCSENDIIAYVKDSYYISNNKQINCNERVVDSLSLLVFKVNGKFKYLENKNKDYRINILTIPEYQEIYGLGTKK